MDLRSLNKKLEESISLLNEGKTADGTVTIEGWYDKDDNEWNLEIEYTVADYEYGADRDSRRGMRRVDLEDWSVSHAELVYPTKKDLEPGEKLPKFNERKLSRKELKDLGDQIEDLAREDYHG